MRRSTRFLLFTACEAALLGLFAAHASVRRRDAADEWQRMRQVVENFQLTDVAVFTEARYTRHPSQADLSSAFQEHPLALEHFPSGSLVPPEAARPGAGQDR